MKLETARTTGCHKHNHPELVVEYAPDAVLATDVQWITSGLESMVAQGRRFADGQTLQLGWMVTRFRDAGDGALAFLEPTMKTMPVEWQPGLTNTLRHMRLQKDILESFLPSDALSFPSLTQSCIICNEVSQTSAVMLDRQAPSGADDSGWFIGCRSDAHGHDKMENLARVSLYEAVVEHAPAALPFLALPTGAMVGLGGARPVVFLNGEKLPMKPGSFLDAKFGPEGG